MSLCQGTWDVLILGAALRERAGFSLGFELSGLRMFGVEVLRFIGIRVCVLFGIRRFGYTRAPKVSGLVPISSRQLSSESTSSGSNLP